MAQAYKSIFFNDDWALPKYHGWAQTSFADDLKLLSKRFGPFRRQLLLSQGHDLEEIGDLLARRGAFDGRTEAYVHLFDAGDERSLILGGREFLRARDDQRILNIATFVIDLSISEEELWKNFGAKGRNAARKPLEENAVVRFSATPDESLDAFYSFYEAISQSANLKTPPRLLLETMMKGGNLVAACCRNRAGEIEAVNLIYLCDGVGFYMYGASQASPAVGVGQFMQWETIKYLRAAGMRHYDLGGVSSTDGKDGIFRFKKGLGGVLLPLGAEFIYRPTAVIVAQRSLEIVRSWRKSG